MDALDLRDRADPDAELDSEPDAPSELKASPVGDMVNMRSSID